MPTSDTKKKATRKSASKAVEPKAAAGSAEETIKPARKSAARKTVDGASSVKHRGVARKSEPVETPAESKTPNHSDIEVLAYMLWEKRGYQHGSHLEDWLIAEKQLLS